MKKKVWILNHYAGNMLFDKGGRHYWFAKYLDREGYAPVVFAANAKHGIAEKWVESDSLWVEKPAEEIETPFVYVKARLYSGNGKARVLNMISFYRNVKKAAVEYSKKHGKPDVILASSVHPLTMVAGIKLAKKFKVKCISEVRDLWPESIVAYSSKWNRTNPIMRMLYAGEKWIYKKSDCVIMTWAGGYDYIQDRGWQNDIPESKVKHISNGVDLEPFLSNVQGHPYEDDDLSNHAYKYFIYTGSVRMVNNLGLLVAAARELKNIGNTEARIVVFGDGNELESLKSDAKDLDNIIFKGRVPKQYIPSILSQGYASILHNSSTELDKYGQSQNKFFEYLAAGHPILMTYSVGHSVVKEYGCGIELDSQDPKSIAEAIVALCDLSEDEYKSYCQNAAECAKKFDYKELCNQLITVIDQSIQATGEESK